MLKRGMRWAIALAGAAVALSGPLAAAAPRGAEGAERLSDSAIRAQIVTLAEREIGYRERGDYCTKFGPCEVWCSLLVTWVWRHAGVAYRDNLVKVVVDVPDTIRNRKWMKAFKGRWKGRLEQLELWMVSYRIEIE